MNTKRAFTIIELLVVVAVIAVIIMLIAMNFQKTLSAARDKIRISHIQEIRLALQEYRAQCGEFPARLELNATSPRCPTDFTLGSVLSEIPENPDYTNVPGYFSAEGIDGNYYFYAGLGPGPRCYDYHLGVVLETGVDESAPLQERILGKFLNEDHDCPRNTSISTGEHCVGSELDFSGGENDIEYQIYDFKSSNTC